MDYLVITSPEELARYLPQLQTSPIIGVDTETTGLDPHTARLRLIQLAVPGLPVILIDCFPFLPAGTGLLREIFAGKSIKVFQNAKFDLQFFLPLHIFPRPLFDTMLAAQLLRQPGEERSVSLKALAARYLGEQLDKEEQISDWNGVLTASQLDYAARDADIMLRLHEILAPRLKERRLNRVAEIEFLCVHAIADMEYYGVHLDLPRWKRLRDQFIVEQDAARQALYRFTGPPMTQMTLWGDEEVLNFNFDSSTFVLRLLRENGISVNATSQRDLAPYRSHPLVKAFLEYRRTAKAISAFLLPIPEMLHQVTGRLHPWYGQISAFSGRTSCANPNIQQIPRSAAFRACFCAPQGKRLILADYSQIELRVAAEISGDRRMLEAYQKGADLHLLTASLMTGKEMSQVTKEERQAAKAVNFGLIYGMGAAGLQQYAQVSYGVDMSAKQAEEFRARFFQAYRGIYSWHAKLRRGTGSQAEGRTLTGRRFFLNGSAGVAMLSNTPVQGTAADIAKLALGLIAQRLEGSEIHPIAMVHDEILLECPEALSEQAAALLKDAMEKAGAAILRQVSVPAEVKISRTWAEK